MVGSVIFLVLNSRTTNNVFLVHQDTQQSMTPLGEVEKPFPPRRSICMDRLATPATSSTATCHCKAIKLTFPTPTEKLNECHCTICRRYGALWAYYNPKDVQIEGPKTDTYQFGEKNNDFHRCPSCGCMTHETDAKDENATEMGVNCNMLEKEELRRFERTVDEHGDAPPLKVNNVPDEYEP